jgi:Putative zinc- or iron-chelating domain
MANIYSHVPGDKHPGSVRAFMKKYVQGVKRGEVSVPCDTCNACCRSAKIIVELSEEEAKRHGGEPDAEYGWRMPKGADGSCIKLVDGKCSIYADRPFVCRTYDCRWSMLIGFMPTDDPPLAEALRQWASFSIPTPEDKDTWVAIRLAIASGGLPNNSDEAMEKATRLETLLG